MTNISILTVSEFKKEKKIAASFLIKGLQKFEIHYHESYKC